MTIRWTICERTVSPGSPCTVLLRRAKGDIWLLPACRRVYGFQGDAENYDTRPLAGAGRAAPAWRCGPGRRAARQLRGRPVLRDPAEPDRAAGAGLEGDARRGARRGAERGHRTGPAAAGPDRPGPGRPRSPRQRRPGGGWRSVAAHGPAAGLGGAHTRRAGAGRPVPARPRAPRRPRRSPSPSPTGAASGPGEAGSARSSPSLALALGRPRPGAAALPHGLELGVADPTFERRRRGASRRMDGQGAGRAGGPRPAGRLLGRASRRRLRPPASTPPTRPIPPTTGKPSTARCAAPSRGACSRCSSIDFAPRWAEGPDRPSLALAAGRHLAAAAGGAGPASPGRSRRGTRAASSTPPTPAPGRFRGCATSRSGRRRTSRST